MLVTETTTEPQIHEVPINRAAQRALDQSMSIRERVSLALQSYGRREVYQSVDDVAAKAGVKSLAAYQAIWRMANKGQVEILRESNGHGRERIVGFKLNFGESPEKVITKGVQRAKRAPRAMGKVKEVKVTSSLALISAYMNQKIAIQKANEILESNGLSHLMVTSEVNPLAEESLLILQELAATKQLYAEALIEIEGARREIAALRG